MLKLTLLIALGFAICGCGANDPRGQVTGKVTFQGQAVTQGDVLFHNNAKGVHMTVKLNPDGTYLATSIEHGGVPVGTYKVCVRPPMAPMPPMGVTNAPKFKGGSNIPQKYRNVKTSGLTLTVEEGENSFDIAM